MYILATLSERTNQLPLSCSELFYAWRIVKSYDFLVLQ